MSDATALRVRRVALRAVELDCAERGDPAGTPVVFLHGVTDSRRSFEPVLPLLPASIRAIAVSQRGHGDSTRPERGYRFADFAGDLAALLDALGIDAAVVVGHSMGAGVAQRFAIDHPERLLGLVLAGSFGSMPHSEAVRGYYESSIAPLAEPVPPAFARAFQESTLAQPIAPAFLDLVVQESLRVPARVWKEVFAGFLAADLLPELRAITVPTRIVWGARDAFCTRADQDALCKAIPHAELVVYDDAGHALHWEEPVRFAADVAAFVASLDFSRRL
jgi:pimeloyl-ACP methyl ester carboxylesterase